MTSDTVRCLRAAVDGSAILRLAAAGGRALLKSGAAPALDAETARLETDAIRDLAERSRIVRALLRWLRAAPHAWSATSSRRAVARLVDEAARLNMPQRIRAVGLWLFVSASVVATATPLDPRPTNLYRWMLWAAAFALAVLAMARAEVLATAWADWRARFSRSSPE